MSGAQSIGISLQLTALPQQIYKATNNSEFSEQEYTLIFAVIERINGKLDEIKYSE